MQDVERDRNPARARLRGVARRAGHHQRRDPAQHGTRDREQLRDRALTAIGAVDPERDPSRDAEQPEHELEVEIPAAERRRAREWDHRADRER